MAKHVMDKKFQVTMTRTYTIEVQAPNAELATSIALEKDMTEEWHMAGQQVECGEYEVFSDDIT